MNDDVLTPDDIAKVKHLGAERYNSKRRSGISPIHKSGWEGSVDIDIQAAGAELAAAKALGCTFNEAIYAASGDGGFDFMFSMEVEVVWIGRNIDGTPREVGHLIMSPDDPHRFADVYVVMSGCVDSGYKCLGWCTHKQLLAGPRQNFGYGERLSLHTSRLQPILVLQSLKRELDFMDALDKHIN